MQNDILFLQNKTFQRETRGFSHAGIALVPRGTRVTRNAI